MKNDYLELDYILSNLHCSFLELERRERGFQIETPSGRVQNPILKVLSLHYSLAVLSYKWIAKIIKFYSGLIYFNFS